MTLVYLVVVFPVLVGFASFGVDYARVQLVKTQLMVAAEAAARAAANQLPNGVTAVQNAAVLWGGYNSADGSAVSINSTSDVVFGTWSTSTRTFTVLTGSSRSSANAVQVTARCTASRNTGVPLLFAGILGQNFCEASESCIAMSNTGTSLNYASGFSGDSSQFTANGTATIPWSNSYWRLTDGGGSERASFWSNTKQNITNFTTTFTFQLTSANADGITFCIQNTGLNAIGQTGGGLGYGDDYTGGSVTITNSICVSFDLYDNAGEGDDATGLFTGGAAPVGTTDNDLSSTSIDLHSGHIFSVTFTYDGATLTESITDNNTTATWNTTYTVNIPAAVGAGTAYVGFTGGTGGSTATQKILTWTFSSPGGSSIVK